MKALTVATIPLALFAFLAIFPTTANASHRMECKVKAEVTKSVSNIGATHTTFKVITTRGKYCKQFYKGVVATITEGGPHATSHKVGDKINALALRITPAPGRTKNGKVGKQPKPFTKWSFAAPAKQNK